MKKFLSKILISSLLILTVFQHSAFAATSHDNTAYFLGVTLSESIPKTFYKNEVYIIKGKVTSANNDIVTVVVQKMGTNKTTMFTGAVTNNSFSVPVFLQQSGSFYIGIIPGENENSKALTIKVLENLPTTEISTTAPKINFAGMNYKEDQTVVEINTAFPSLKKVNFVQGDKQVTYISRQNVSSIPINYKDFKNFLGGKVYFDVSVARIENSQSTKITSDFTKIEAKSFIATEHTFSEISSEEITANPIDISPTIRTISFSGKVKTDTDLQAYVIKPNGFVDTFDLTTSSPKGDYFGKTTIKAGGEFTFSYTPKTKGRYILEISDKDGLPILNHPTYIGKSIPLIPDFFDLNDRTLFKSTFDITKLRQELLSQINQARKKHGLPSIISTNELNNFAQEHSKDMADNNYFSHNNLEGQSPNDRRIEMKIKTPTSENIAKDVSIAFAHNGLMRSASHRSNILQEDWTLVGLGIVKKGGYLYITEEFATSIPTEDQLETNKNDLFTTINNYRETNAVPKLTYSPSLELVGKEINTATITEESILSNTLLSNTLDEFGIDGDTLAIGRTYNSWTPIVDSIIDEEPRILEDYWKTIGVNIQIDNFGNIVTLIILNES